MVTPSKDIIEAELQQSFLTYDAALAAWYAANPYTPPPAPTTPEEYAAQADADPTGYIQTFPYTAATAPPPPPAPLEEGYVYGIDAFTIPEGARFTKELPISIVHEPSGKVMETYYGSQRASRKKIADKYNITFLDPITKSQLDVAAAFGDAPAAWSYQDRGIGASVGIFAQGFVTGIATLPYELLKLPKYAGQFVSDWASSGNILYPAQAGIEFIGGAGKEFAKRPFYVGGQITGVTAITAGAGKLGSRVTKKFKSPIKETIVDEISPTAYKKTRVTTQKNKVLSEFEYKFDVETIGDVTMKGKRYKIDVSLITPEERAIYSADIRTIKPYDTNQVLLVSKRITERGFLPRVEKATQWDIITSQKPRTVLDSRTFNPFKPDLPPTKPKGRIIYPKWDEPITGGTMTKTSTRTGTMTLTQERVFPKTKVKTKVISATNILSEQRSMQKSMSASIQLKMQDQKSMQTEVRQLTRTKQATRVKPKYWFGTGVISKSEQKSMQTSMQEQIVKTDVIQKRASALQIKTIQVPISKTKTTTKAATRQVPISKTKTTTKAATRTRVWPMKIRLDKPFKPRQMRTTTRRKLRRKTEYTPTLSAWAANIRKKLSRQERKARFTGFEVRPIPLDKPIKRKSRKKTKRRRKK